MEEVNYGIQKTNYVTEEELRDMSYLYAKTKDDNSYRQDFLHIELAPVGADMLVFRLTAEDDEQSKGFHKFIQDNEVVTFDFYFRGRHKFSYSILDKEAHHTIIGVNTPVNDDGIIVYEVQCGFMGFYPDEELIELFNATRVHPDLRGDEV